MPDTPPPALLVVNLGTPDAPTPRAVRRYLAEFLHDHRVVQLTRWLWCPLLHFVILPLRGPKAAAKYASIWLPDGSPLAVHTRRLAAAMQAEGAKDGVYVLAQGALSDSARLLARDHGIVVLQGAGLAQLLLRAKPAGKGAAATRA